MHAHPPFTYKVAVYAPAKRADTFTPVSSLLHYVYSVVWSTVEGQSGGVVVKIGAVLW
jgi:hypothetical protein